MNSKIIKRHLISSSFIICTLSFSMMLPSCTEWDDHYEAPVTQSAGELTLWQTLQQRPELSDFREVLSKTMLMRQHRKTGVSYADLLDGAQAFTVMAPVNGSFDKDSLLDLLTTDKGDSMVVRNFVGNHLSYSLTNSTATPTEFFLLNTKRATIGNGEVLGVPIKEANVPAKGGLLHVMEKAMPYRHNLYEALVNDPRYSAIGKQLSSYEEDEFSPSKSVEGGMVDGEQVYVDSVFDEHNIILDRVGKIATEDSSFIMVVPTADEWQRVWQEAMDHFRYDAKVIGGDSLQRFWANYSLMNDAIFSRMIQNSPEDSLITYNYNRKYPQYHVFHKPFQEGGILYGATPTEYSNGTLYTTDKWPFLPQSTYWREIKSEGERTGMILSYDLCTYTTRKHIADSVSENEYLVITPSTVTSNWTMTFKLENTLAGAYDIFVVLLPQTIYNPNATIKPCMFNAAINYVDEKGNAQVYDCGGVKFSNDPTRVDTLLLAENFVFPVCNYDQQNMKISLTLTCNIRSIETRKYAREMFLDCIYLRPRKTEITEQ